MLDLSTVDFHKADGLVPAVVQDAATRRVLMLGYMNAEAAERTQQTGRVTFWSRSRGEIWKKGETSGHGLALVSMSADCDADALLVLATPSGPTCHTGAGSCFDAAVGGPSTGLPADGDAPADTLGVGRLAALDATIAQRLADGSAESYVRSLSDAGLARAAQKVGEEGVETVIAALSGDDAELAGEAADLVFHLLVLLRLRGLGLADVLAVLASRER